MSENVNSISEADNSQSTNLIESKKQHKEITDYREGETYKKKIIKRLYFCNKVKKYIIIKTDDGVIRVCGENPTNITPLLAECKYLTDTIKSNKVKEWYDYQRATAINTYLIGEEDKSKCILNELINKLQQRQMIKKKIWYIGVFLIVTILMLLLSLVLSIYLNNLSFTKYIKIATFGAIGGFISLNIKLNEMKFEVSESTASYVIVSIYKVVFSMMTGVVSYFLIESDIILSVIKSKGTNSQYFIYTIATIAGFSESLLPNLFKTVENSSVSIDGEKDKKIC